MTRAAVAQKSQTAELIVIALLVTLVFAAAYMVGSNRLRETTAAQAKAVEIENKSFCGDLGLTPESKLFARCVRGLTEIRQRARERFEEETASLL